MAVKQDFLSYVSEAVTIIRPMPAVVPRGTASPLERQPTISIRFPIEQREAVEEAADVLRMTRSEFVRWCAYYVALDILKQKQQYDKLR